MDLTEFGFRADFDENNRVVKQDYVLVDGKEYFVSTVDLGLNHQFYDGPHLYFETMIFPKGGWGELYCNRYSTREAALEKHEKLVSDINSGKYEIVDGWFELKDTDPTESA